MKSRTRLTGLVIGLILVMAIALAAYSQSGTGQRQKPAGRQGMCKMQGMKGMQGPGQGFRGLLAGLNLTDTQKQQIAQISKKHQAEVQPIRQQLKDKSISLAEDLTAKDPNRAEIRATVKQINSLHERLTLAGIDRLLDISKILTPEQKRILNTRINERKTNGMGMTQGMGMVPGAACPMMGAGTGSMAGSCCTEGDCKCCIDGKCTCADGQCNCGMDCCKDGKCACAESQACATGGACCTS